VTLGVGGGVRWEAGEGLRRKKHKSKQNKKEPRSPFPKTAPKTNSTKMYPPCKKGKEVTKREKTKNVKKTDEEKAGKGGKPKFWKGKKATLEPVELQMNKEGGKRRKKTEAGEGEERGRVQKNDGTPPPPPGGKGGRFLEKKQRKESRGLKSFGGELVTFNIPKRKKKKEDHTRKNGEEKRKNTRR